GSLVLFLFLGVQPAFQAADPPIPAVPDLSEYRTVDNAVTAKIKPIAAHAATQPGYLGISVAGDPGGKLVVAMVEVGSPAAKAGLRAGDTLVHVAGQIVANEEILQETLLAKSPGESVKLSVQRQGKPLELTATLAATSRPMKLGGQRVFLGINLGDSADGDGYSIDRVIPNSPAANAGLKTRGVPDKIHREAVTSPSKLSDALLNKQNGDTLVLTIRKDGKVSEVKVTLSGERGGGRRGGFGEGRSWDARGMFAWKKDLY